MTEPPHLTPEQVAGYRNRTLAPADLLDADSHLSACESCRDRLYAGVRATPKLMTMRADLSGHLDYAGVVACASGDGSAEQHDHLAICAECRAEVDDLRSFQTELRETPRAPLVMPVRASRSWRVPLTIAAGIALVGGAVWTLRPSRPEPEPPAVAKVQQSTEASLTAAERQTLDLAMASGKLEHAPILDRLISKQGTLLGPGGDSKKFDLVGPVGTAVAEDRPTFRWQALPGATSYTVSVVDENFETVASGHPVTGTEWQPDQPLPRGRVLNWQVSAKVGGETVHAPVPPAPEARFTVISAEDAAGIEAARRDHPNNHLLLAALYAKAGDVQDASKELDALDPATAAPYRDSLKK